MSADEFDIIAKYFAPLATSPGARGLIDDVAVLETSGRLVVTTDAIVEGVHFLPDDPLDTVAKKALRVNISDLAAKGAKPTAALLTLIWPSHRNAADIAIFARGLADDLKHFDIALLGGDTTATPGPLTVSMTLFGEATRIPSRADAKPGQDLWVSGPIGDAFLGLRALRENLTDAANALLAQRYRVPAPALDARELVSACAGASMDVSDGLLADAAKIAAASGVRLRVEMRSVPFSPEASAWLAEAIWNVFPLLTGGDDYQILMTADIAHRTALQGRFQRIGSVVAGAGVDLIDHNGETVQIEAAGYSHKLGR